MDFITIFSFQQKETGKHVEADQADRFPRQWLEGDRSICGELHFPVLLRRKTGAAAEVQCAAGLNAELRHVRFFPAGRGELQL